MSIVRRIGLPDPVATAVAVERERCAKVCDDIADKAGDAPVSDHAGGRIWGAQDCAAAIRSSE